MEVVDGDATAMPFDDGRFSGVASFTMLHHVPTVELQDAILSEARRVLRPGGLLVANDSVGARSSPPSTPATSYNPIDPATLERRLSAAGFDAIEVEHNEFAWACRARRR